MPHAAASFAPDMAALSESGAWGGIVILVASIPIAACWTWVLVRRSSARRQATRRRHGELLRAAASQQGGELSEGGQAARRRIRARWRDRVTAASRGRR